MHRDQSLILLFCIFIAGCGNCGYFKRLIDSQCRSADVTSGTTTVVNCLSLANSDFPTLASGQSFITASLSCPKGFANTWKIGNAPQTGAPTFCNHYSNGTNYLMLLVANNSSASFKASNGVTYGNCNDLWDAVGDQSLKTTDIAGIFVSTVSCKTVTCSDSGGCTVTPNSNGHVFLKYDPASPELVERTPISISSGSYLGCAFIDSYGFTNTGDSPLPPVGVQGLNLGIFLNLPLVGPTTGDTTTNLPVPHSGSLVSAGTGPDGLAQYDNQFTTFQIDASTATVITGGQSDSPRAVSLNFSTWKDFQ